MQHAHCKPGVYTPSRAEGFWRRSSSVCHKAVISLTSSSMVLSFSSCVRSGLHRQYDSQCQPGGPGRHLVRKSPFVAGIQRLAAEDDQQTAVANALWGGIIAAPESLEYQHMLPVATKVGCSVTYQVSKEELLGSHQAWCRFDCVRVSSNMRSMHKGRSCHVMLMLVMVCASRMYLSFCARRDAMRECLYCRVLLLT